jgi:ADP-ribose pyrophosphatase
VSKQVEIISKKELFRQSFFQVEEVELRHERYDGQMSEPFVRLNFNRGDSVAAVVHDQQRDAVVLVEQFRYPAYENGPGWILELPAGIYLPDKDKTPERTMWRELQEEIGYEVNKLQHINTFYLSPGGSSERLYLYYASISLENDTGPGGGIPEEGEDIHRLTFKVGEALAKVDKGEIVDAKTIIGLQWLRRYLDRK